MEMSISCRYLFAIIENFNLSSNVLSGLIKTTTFSCHFDFVFYVHSYFKPIDGPTMAPLKHLRELTATR